MKKIFAAIALTAGIASAQSFIRTHTIVSDNSTFPTPANVEWMQGESVRFEITAKSGNFYIPLSNGVAPVLKMWSGNVITQLYAQKTGSIYNAGSGKLYVDLLANEANISPSGAYNYAVGVYDGTQYMGVVAQGRATVRGHPFGASVGYVGAFNAFPYVPTNDANYLGGITGAVAGANVSIARTGRTVYISATAGGGGSGTFTNFLWGTNSSTAQGIVAAGSNNTLRSAGGTNYLDGTLFSTLYTVQNGGGLSVSQGSGPTAVLTVTNSTHLGGLAASAYATGAPIYSVTQTGQVNSTGGSYVAADWSFKQSGDSPLITVSASYAALDSDGSAVYAYEEGGIRLFGNTTNSGTFTSLGGFIGSGSGLTGLNGASITNLSAFQSIATEGSGNVITNLVSGGSVITQQMGTVTGAGSTSTLYRVESQVSGIGFTTANGPTAVLTGAVTAVSAAPWVDTWEVANTITTQILSSSSWSNVNFDTYAPENPGRNYNITNDVLTFSSTGLCHVTAAARIFSMSSANRVQMMLYRNGAQYRQGIVLTATTNATPTISVSFYNHAATNTYTIAVIQEDAVAREIRGGGSTGAYLVWASGYRFRNTGE